MRQKPASSTGAGSGRQEHPSKYANRDWEIVGHALFRLGRKVTPERIQGLLAELVDHGYLVYARYRAIRGAGLYRVKFVLKVLRSVLLERYSGKTTLLRTVMYQSIFADV